MWWRARDDTTVQPGGVGPRYSATAVWYDPRNDLAILRVAGDLDLPALQQNVNARAGHLGGGPRLPGERPARVEPARLGPTITALTPGRLRQRPDPAARSRRMRGEVRSGNSGGPVVDGSGRVLTTVFASSAGRGERAGYGVPDSVVREALGGATRPVGHRSVHALMDRR